MNSRVWAGCGAAAGILWGFSGCSQPARPDIVCTELFAYGLNVSVVDSINGTPAVGAKVTAQDGSYTETQTVTATPQESAVPLAGERAGIYTITVEKAGYKTWARGGVTVTKDACHVHPVAVTAKLQA